MERQSFINIVKDGAIAAYKEFGILPSLTIAQAILESGWGDSGLTKQANNLFGIKGSGNAGSVTMPTTEYYNGARTTVNADFRKYNSLADSIIDHTKLLLNDRYTAVRKASNYVEACRAVQACGYATDPKYADLLINIIQENGLDKYDTKEEDPIINGVVTASVLNVRDGAGTDCKILGTLPNGTKVKIDKRYSKDNWWSIYYGDHGGFVHKNYIKLV